jgi:hypothetical protein
MKRFLFYHIKGKTMNWNKTPIKILVTFACIILLFFSPQRAPAQTPPPGLPADFNFEDFMKNLEQALKEVEEEEAVATKEDEKTSIEPAEPTLPQTKSPLSTPTEKDDQVTEEIQSQQPIKKDPESLFIEPATQIITDAAKKTKKTEPTQLSVKAFHTITNEFIDRIESVEKKVMDSTGFSLEFEEQFIPLLENADQVIVALRQIASKKAYIHLFITPPTTNQKLAVDFKKIRKQIIDLHHRLKKIDTALVIKAEKEILQEEDVIQKKLKKMATESDENNNTIVTPTPNKKTPLIKPLPQKRKPAQTDVASDSMDK